MPYVPLSSASVAGSPKASSASLQPSPSLSVSKKSGLFGSVPLSLSVGIATPVPAVLGIPLLLVVSPSVSSAIPFPSASVPPVSTTS